MLSPYLTLTGRFGMTKDNLAYCPCAPNMPLAGNKASAFFPRLERLRGMLSPNAVNSDTASP